jgi:glycosyltransferase involved in cell wall biosynthesis
MLRSVRLISSRCENPARALRFPAQTLHDLERNRTPLLTPVTPLKKSKLLVSVLIPVYNEAGTIAEIVERVRAAPYTTEIICVDDCSTDGTRDLLARLLSEGQIQQALYQKVNKGKGAAVRAAIAASHGDIVIVQDADLEYSPADWPTLFEPLVQGRADAVFGSRFLGGTHRVLYYWHSVGNGFLTTLSNMFSNLNLTDMECCYKAVRGEMARSLTLKSERFGFEPEITARLARANARIFEVPVGYSGRTYLEGKKITWRDGFAALFHILRYNLFP